MIVREPLLSRQASRAVDAALIASGLPGVLLMENAGRGAAEIVRSMGSRVVVIAGPGNNGGDGYVIARHLTLAGAEVDVASLVDPAQLRGDAAVMASAWRALGGTISRLDEGTNVVRDLRGCVVIDALFGTGLARGLEGLPAQVVGLVRASGADRVVALDLPSGLDAETGAALGPVIPAHDTLTFGTSKPGLHTGEGIRLAGRVTVVAIGAGIPVALRDGATVHRVASARVPVRAGDAHKGDNGHVGIVGGSAGTTGAACLSARGAHRAGAGLVTIATRAQREVDAKVTETMSHGLGGDARALRGELATFTTRMDACVAGPGLGRDAWAETAMRTMWDDAGACVFDADGLTWLASASVHPRAAATVLTPHPLEMARLLGRPDARSVNADRIAAAREAAVKFGAIVVLKGAGSVIADPSGAVDIVDVAEPALAVGGSGDVLSGVIAARLAERTGAPPRDRVVEAVMAHARAGQQVHRARGTARGTLASEIADAVSAMLESRD